MRLVYNYHPETSRLLQATEADESPLEEGVYLIPAFATESEPPEVGEGQYAAFVEGSWQVLDESMPESTPDPAPSTPQQIKVHIIAATQERLDAFAQTRGYDGILSCATYISSSVTRFQAEGQRAVQARDETWAALYGVLAEVESGTRPMPSGYADIEADLPVLAWLA